ncbi:hypothetical protein [Ideonella dechloratans]|uniref:hypothetical protein n=1 Tax=Ideonella dechloratans TaxID=36863 RepID=UPI0035B4F097
MQASWEDGFDQRVFMARLINHAGTGGAIRYDAEWTGLIALFRSMIKFSENLPWAARHQLLSDAAREAIAARATTPKELLQHVQSAIDSYTKTPKSPFVMYTSITVMNTNTLPSAQIGNVRITFPKSMPSRVTAARADLFSRNRHWLPIDHEPTMKVVKMKVEARNHEEAVNQCIDAIDLLRGIWNFFKTASWRLTFGGPTTPINSVFLGPLHTIHDQVGILLNDQFWYEPNFYRNASFSDLNENNNAVIRRAQGVRKILSKHLYSTALTDAFIRYARALDLEDHDLSIQKLWSLLEYLTNTGRSTYDTTIRRSKFLYREVAFQGQVLEHLRRYRNRSVHGGSSSGDVECEVYQMKRLVETALKFHLGNRFKFSTLAEACDFLDLPPDTNLLRARQKNLQLAISFRSA